MKKLVFIFALLVMVFTGCSGKSAKNEDRTDMDFTVVPREDMPDAHRRVQYKGRQSCGNVG